VPGGLKNLISCFPASTFRAYVLCKVTLNDYIRTFVITGLCQ